MNTVLEFWKKLNNQERIKLAMTVASVPMLVMQLKRETDKRWVPDARNGYFMPQQPAFRITDDDVKQGLFR